MSLAQADQAWSDQYDQQQAEQAAQKAQEAQPKQPPSFMQQWVTGPIGRVTTSMMDSAVSAADSYSNSDAGHKTRDVVAGAITGAVNTVDAAGSAIATSGREMAAAEDPAHADEARAGTMPGSPIWDHAKGAILDFRDAVAVQDPTLADNLVQSAAQLAIPFAGYSRALAGLHGVANTVAAGAATDATALDPHAPRMADLIALGKQTDGKLGDALRWLGPHGLNAYVNFLASDPKDSEAEGRFKNVLDGLGSNLIAVPLLHAAGVVLKQGTAGLRYAVENGVGSAGDLMPANQRGAVGDITNVSPIRKPGNIEEQPTPSSAPQLDTSYKPGSPLYESDRIAQLNPSPAVRARRQAILDTYNKAVADLRAGGYTPENGDHTPDVGLTLEGGGKPAAPIMQAPELPPENRDPYTGGMQAPQLPPDQIGAAQNTRVSNSIRSIIGKVNDTGMQTKTGTVGKLLGSVSQNLSDETPEGEFYKDLYKRLAAKVDPDTKIVPEGAPGHNLPFKTWGSYNMGTNSISLAKDLATSTKADPMHVLAHEATHSVLMRQVEDDPVVQEQLQGVARDALDSKAVKGLTRKDQYGVTNLQKNGDVNIDEFMAEAHSNPRFQAALKNTPGRIPGMSLWDEYKGIAGHMLGLPAAVIGGALFDKILTAQEKKGA